ncbi:protein of unknown function [Candidatus Methylomirabilis oxygeniifera]|uniref:Uncharacterized protein n=1 Tax=Methylomirabilis oxygeniifera TaxID=671143 RepID=D5MK87_METO1|nr:protein of unknown function [Candidatus Methylomirabilis oxyfera]
MNGCSTAALISEPNVRGRRENRPRVFPPTTNAPALSVSGMVLLRHVSKKACMGMGPACVATAAHAGPFWPVIPCLIRNPVGLSRYRLSPV